MIVLAPDFVDVVFGSRWHAAIPVLQILSYVGLIQSLTVLVANVLLTLDRAATLFWLTALGSVAMVGAFALGLRWGLLGVTSTYAIANTPVTALFLVFAAKVTGVRLRDFAGALRGVITAAVVMAIVVFGARRLLEAEGVPASARLAILVLLGAATYLPLCAWGATEVTSEIRNVLRLRGGSQQAAP